MRRGLLASVLLVASVLLALACAPASKGSRRPPQPKSALPVEAFELLTRSTTDSCAVCVRDLRKRAFRILADRFPPGVTVRTDSANWFARVPGGGNALRIASGASDNPWLTFRFHTADDHLVGISASDMTSARLAERLRSAPGGARFRGAIEIVPFEYGDGLSFLYHASDNTVEVHCKILEIDAE